MILSVKEKQMRFNIIYPQAFLSCEEVSREVLQYR
jgi:hypothetical protein